MNITNNANLPLPLVEAVRKDPYNNGQSDITVTTLLKPARAVALERQHKDEIEEDASDRIFALIGQIGHSILERGASGQIVERRLFTEMGGWKVSGQVDVIPPDLLVDYKFTSVWSCKDGIKPEWTQQLNMLHLLCARNDITVLKAQIVAIYRDWSKLEARRSADYPPHQVQVFDIPLWPFGVVEDYMLKRIEAHQDARKELPECTPEERWERPSKWAVKKEGKERAVRVYDTEEAAERHVLDAVGHLMIEHRPGEQVRCANYCSARPFCTQADALGVQK